MTAALRIGFCGLLCGALWLGTNANVAQAASPHVGHVNSCGFRHGFSHEDSAAIAPVFAGAWGGYGYGGCGYGVGLDDREPPFYALFPPVYYSCPVPRTYGYSPFAYPACVETPPIVQDGGPAEIINPYVPPSNKAKPMSGRTADAGTSDSLDRVKVVVNPYVSNRVAER